MSEALLREFLEVEVRRLGLERLRRGGHGGAGAPTRLAASRLASASASAGEEVGPATENLAPRVTAPAPPTGEVTSASGAHPDGTGSIPRPGEGRPSGFGGEGSTPGATPPSRAGQPPSTEEPAGVRAPAGPACAAADQAPRDEAEGGGDAPPSSSEPQLLPAQATSARDRREPAADTLTAPSAPEEHDPAPDSVDAGTSSAGATAGAPLTALPTRTAPPRADPSPSASITPRRSAPLGPGFARGLGATAALLLVVGVVRGMTAGGDHAAQRSALAATSALPPVPIQTVPAPPPDASGSPPPATAHQHRAVPGGRHRSRRRRHPASHLGVAVAVHPSPTGPGRPAPAPPAQQQPPPAGPNRYVAPSSPRPANPAPRPTSPPPPRHSSLHNEFGP